MEDAGLDLVDDEIIDLVGDVKSPATPKSKKKTVRIMSDRNTVQEFSPYDHGKKHDDSVEKCVFSEDRPYPTHYPCRNKYATFQNNKQYFLRILAVLTKPMQSLIDLQPELERFNDDFIRLVKTVTPYIKGTPLAKELSAVDEKFFELFESMDALRGVQEWIHGADDGTVGDDVRGKVVVVRDIPKLKMCVEAIEALHKKGDILDIFDIFVEEIGHELERHKIQGQFLRKIMLNPLHQTDQSDLLPRRDVPDFESWRRHFVALCSVVKKKVDYLNRIKDKYIVHVFTDSKKHVASEKKRLGNKSLKQFRREWLKKTKKRK
jgi:hypothetical protein